MKRSKNKFEILDTVYHITPGSPRGIIHEIRYWHSSDSYDYLVLWGYNDKSFSSEDELTKEYNT